MKRTILSAFVALAAVVIALPMFAAFEAHVVNVTARIENALRVPIEYLEFGTVFPQEHLAKPLDINLSQSFIDEDRVDDVEYFIRQKPKCAITRENGTVYDNTVVDGAHIYTGTGHIKFGDDPSTQVVEPSDHMYIDCGPAPRDLAQGETWGVLPNLCPYLSKHSEIVSTEPLTYEDGVLASFHQPWTITGTNITWNDVPGHLAKSNNDVTDNWLIDLAVPCFTKHCAQDWETFVAGINPLANPADYVQPIANEHKVFGCDLWVEVGGISLPGLGCKDKVDVMIVMDNSGSISPADFLTMQNAAKAFVNALLLSPDGPHSGKVSFASGATLDQPLTDDATAVNTAIDIAQSGGSTNLSAGIDVGQTELAGPNGRADAPNVMIILTDGAPNIGSPDGPTAATASATAAKGAGTEIFAVGIGTSLATSDYLHDNIVSDIEDQHYFDAADFDDLQAILEDLVTCDD